MSLRGRVFDMGNVALKPLGLQLAPLERDFDNRLLSERHLAAMLRRTSLEIERFLKDECIFRCPIDFDIEKQVSDFYQGYLTSPYRLPIGSSRFNSLLWLHMLQYALQPELIIDSGTYLGASAWALSRPSRQHKVVHSFDVRQWPVVGREPNVVYHLSDWTEHDFSGRPTTRVLCYFDDHLDQCRRVLEAHERGLRFLIFDDSASFTNIPLRCKDASPLPKIDFLLDDDLQDSDEIVWTFRGQKQNYKVDMTYLDEARRKIEAMQRLPDLEPCTGARTQLPYRLVTLNSEVSSG